MTIPGASDSLERVQRFASTLDPEGGADSLGSVAAVRGWLREGGFLGTVRSEDERLALLELRSALRQAMYANAGHGEAASAWASIDRMAAEAPLRARFAPRPALEPEGQGVEAVIGSLLAAVYDSVRDGTWPRLKICREDRCAIAFYDRSKNGSGVWCSMAVCGNRNKARRRRTRAAGLA